MGVSLFEILFIILLGAGLWRVFGPFQKRIERRILKSFGRNDYRWGEIIDITPKKKAPPSEPNDK